MAPPACMSAGLLSYIIHASKLKERAERIAFIDLMHLIGHDWRDLSDSRKVTSRFLEDV